MSVLPFDQRDGFIWMNGASSHGARRSCMCSRMACIMPPACSRASALMAGRFSNRRNIPSASNAPPMCSISKFPIRRRARCGQAARRRQEQSHRLLCAPCRLARQRDDGGRGAEFDDQYRDRGLAVAEHVQCRREDEGHPSRYRRISPARSADRADARPRRRAFT